MKLWLLRPVEGLPAVRGENPRNPWYDKTFGFVVRAITEAEARLIAQKSGGDEVGWNNDIPAWLDPKWSTCVELEKKGVPGAIISDTRSA